MNRRTVLTASAALPAAALPVEAVAIDAHPAGRMCPAAIRARIRQVVDTFSVATVAFPNPMPADEARAALALTDAEIEGFGPVRDFALRWGVCLDWLCKGDIGGLLSDGRRQREGERRRAAPLDAETDPAIVPSRAWRDADRAQRVYCDRGEDIPQAEADAEFEALSAIADQVATTPAGLAAQIRAAFEVFGDLRRHSNPEDPNHYVFEGWQDDVDGRLLRSLLEGAERLSAGAHGHQVAYTRPSDRALRELRLRNTMGTLSDDETAIIGRFFETHRAGDTDTAFADVKVAASELDHISKSRLTVALKRVVELSS